MSGPDIDADARRGETRLAVAKGTVARDVSWRAHQQRWRQPAQIISHWADAERVNPRLLVHRIRGRWWRLLEELDVTLLVSREYEHLVMALSVVDGRPRVSYLPMPHPSGLAVDLKAGVAYLASTRNPNQVFSLRPIAHGRPRLDVKASATRGRPLVPIGSWMLPGSLYLHDLAMVGGVLHGNAVGYNAVVRIGRDGGYRTAWWPQSIDTERGPRMERNYLQLNSIAAGSDLQHSYFTASAGRIGSRRPGQLSFPVDGTGVVFSGRTREPIVHGLTRPHSARLFRGTIWLDNSGYGQLGVVDRGQFSVMATLPGWTRGLCFAENVAFVGISRVIPRYRKYAPGLDVARSQCGVYAVDVTSGETIASLTWPSGNQLFAVEVVPRAWSEGFPFVAGARGRGAFQESLFYAFELPEGDE